MKLPELQYLIYKKYKFGCDPEPQHLNGLLAWEIWMIRPKSWLDVITE